MVPERLLALAIVDIADLSREPDLSISAVAAQTAALGATRNNGTVYDIWSDVDCFIKIAATATGVTTSNGYKLFANNVISLYVPQGHKIGGITAGGTGTLSIHRSRTQ